MDVNSIAARKQRWLDLYASDAPGCLFCISYDPEPPERPYPWPWKKEQRTQGAWEAYCHHRGAYRMAARRFTAIRAGVQRH